MVVGSLGERRNALLLCGMESGMAWKSGWQLLVPTSNCGTAARYDAATNTIARRDKKLRD